MLSRPNQRYLPILTLRYQFATVHRFVTARFKGYLCIFAALGTFCREHLPLGSVARAAAPIALAFSRLATGGAAPGLIGVALGLEKLLLFSAEGKVIPQSEHSIDLS
jgi:hypothetical protein